MLVGLKRRIRSPSGLALYDKPTGMTVRMDHKEAAMFFLDYEPLTDWEAPEVVHIELTKRCNLACPYCYTIGQAGPNVKAEVKAKAARQTGQQRQAGQRGRAGLGGQEAGAETAGPPGQSRQAGDSGQGEPEAGQANAKMVTPEPALAIKKAKKSGTSEARGGQSPVAGAVGVSEAGEAVEAGQARDAMEASELTTDQWKAIIRQIADMGAFQLTFGGGEPFLRDDLIELAEYADELGLNVMTTTNGMFLDRFGLDALKIFRQISLSYHQPALEAGFVLSEALDMLKEAGVNPAINFIMSENYRTHLDSVAKLARRHKALLVILTYKPIIPGIDAQVPTSEISETAMALVKEGLRLGLDSLTSEDCGMSERLCVMSCSGEVYPCSFVKQSMGNTLQQTLADIWRERSPKQPCPYMPV